MKIIIDIREQSLYDTMISKLSEDAANGSSITILKQVLPLGDILFVSDEDSPICIIERKTFEDLFASVKDGRYKEQSYRLLNSTEYHKHNVFYLLEGVLRVPKEKTLAYSIMTSLQLFKGFSVIRTSSINETSELLITMATKMNREFKKGEDTLAYSNHMNLVETETSGDINNTNEIIGSNINSSNHNYCNVVKKVKKENITPENIGEIMLCQIPGISSVTAMAIMRKFTSFSNLIEELKTNPDCFENFTMETNGKQRKINKTSIENIKKYLV